MSLRISVVPEIARHGQRGFIFAGAGNGEEAHGGIGEAGRGAFDRHDFFHRLAGTIGRDDLRGRIAIFPYLGVDAVMAAGDDQECRHAQRFQPRHLGLGKGDRTVDHEPATLQAHHRHAAFEGADRHLHGSVHCGNRVVHRRQFAVRQHSPFGVRRRHEDLSDCFMLTTPEGADCSGA
jgi:hypothetical protein